MKKNIVILILILIIIALIIFIIADKRILIQNENSDLAKISDDLVTEYVTEPISESESTTLELTTKSAEYTKTIVIDPGHQSKGNSEKEPIAPGASKTKAKVSSGTSGIVTKTPEYAVNLQVALKLKSELEKHGYNVIMTRETNDVNISNSERAAIANNAKADAFIRIHCNGSTNQDVKGALTMCQSPNNIYCGQLYNQSYSLSENILSSLCEETGTVNKGVVETDEMSGINWCEVPVTIVEMGFITNPEEDRLINSNEYQNKISIGITNGIDNYFYEMP